MVSQGATSLASVGEGLSNGKAGKVDDAGGIP